MADMRSNKKRKRGQGLWVGVALVLCLMLASVTAMPQSTQRAGDWLEDQQDAAGWFPWWPGGGPTTNTQGPSAMGLLAAFLHTGLQGYMDAALLGGTYILDILYLPDSGVSNWSDGTPRIAMHDPLFLEAMGLATGDTVYTDFLSTYYWDPLAAGTYGDPNYSADSLGAVIVGARGQLSMWDIAPAAIAAHLAGRTDVRDDFMGAILDGLEAAPGPGSYDVIGLAGAVWASAITGVELNPSAGRYAGMNTAQLAAELAGMTTSANPGAFMWRSDAEDWYPDDPTNGDLQATAFAIMALYALDADLYAEQIAHGVAFIRSLQLGDGAFDSWLGRNNPNVEAHAEGLTAIAAVAPYIVFVDQANLGLVWGDAPAGDGIVVGYDAFAGLVDGVDGVRLGGTLSVAPGTYDASHPISKPVAIMASGSAADTTLTGDMTLASTGILLGRLGQGFTILGNITVPTGVDASGIAINWNDLYGHVTNEGDGTLDATYNWWAGRHPETATTGDVDYFPFLPRPVDQVIAFVQELGLPIDQALALLELLDARGAVGELVLELVRKFGFTQQEALQIIADYGVARVSRALGRSLSYEDFVRWLQGYGVTPQGGGGYFADRGVVGGAGAYGDDVVDAIYEIGQPIVVALGLEDYTGAPVTDGIVTVGLVNITDGMRRVVYLGIAAYDEETGNYVHEIATEGFSPGFYRLYVSCNDGSHFQELIELVEPEQE